MSSPMERTNKAGRGLRVALEALLHLDVCVEGGSTKDESSSQGEEMVEESC